MSDDPDNFEDTSIDLSSGLARLSQLKNLELDLQTIEDPDFPVIHCQRLGPMGFLSVKDMPNLQTVKLPFHFIIGYDRSPNRLHHIPNPINVLPRALKSLTIRMDFEELTQFLPRRIDPDTMGMDPETPDQQWQPRVAALGFIEAISNLEYGVMPELKEVVYCHSLPRKTYCRCYGMYRADRSYKCEYYPESGYSRLGVYGRQDVGYSERDADISPDSGLPCPPLSFDSALDQHGVVTDVLDRFQALVTRFATQGVKLTCTAVVREYAEFTEIHEKPTEEDLKRREDYMKRMKELIGWDLIQPAIN